MKTAMTKAEAFEVLGLRGDATEEEVKTAYRSLSKRVHPDAGGSDELFRRVHAAYERLTMGPDRDDEPACRAEPSRESDWAPRNEPPDHTRRGLRWWQWPFLVGLGPTTARGCVGLLVAAALVGAQVGSGLPQLLRQLFESLTLLLAVGRIAALPLRVRRR